MELESYTNTNTNQNGNMNVLKKPAGFASKLNNLNETMPLLLDEFQKAYVFYNMAPASEEYKNFYYNARNNVISTNTQLFMTTNDIQKNIETINKDLIILNKNIQKQKKINEKLKKELSSVDSNMDSSKQRINEYTEMYRSKYLSNITVFIGIVIGIFACKKIFTVKNIVQK